MRECDGCTKCCEGWLFANIHGKQMYPGRPCHWVKLGKGCAIYENRPKEPCVTFNCEWKRNEDIPEWMKPSDSNVILHRKKIPNTNIEYIEVTEAGSKLSVEALNWIVIDLLMKGKENIHYKIDGGNNYLGNQDFVDYFLKT